MRPDPIAVPDVAQVSSFRALREAVEATLGTVPFAPPVDWPYAAAVLKDIRERVPGATGEVYHRIRDLVVDVSCAGAKYCLVVKL